MRLFIAIDLPREVLESLGRLVDTLRPTARLKWSPVENLHITTKFAGEWPEARLGEMTGALSDLAKHPLIEISVSGVGFFPNPHHPRVFWAGVHAPPALAELARETDEKLARLGVPSESRPFSPHLTLARVKEPLPPLVSLRQKIAALDSLDFGSFSADQFHLYLSRLSPSGATYTRLASFPI
jgi:2'-5' RNA ligase